MTLVEEPPQPFIAVRGVSKSFHAKGGPRHVLREASLTVRRGEFISILGAMGSGKSTLLSIVAGLTRPDAGTVSIGGQPVRGVGRNAAFVFQNYSLLPWFTALENVRLAVAAAMPELSRAAQREHARLALERVGLGSAVTRRPKQLSGGMRQRVAIARAFATNPDVLFLDEPFGALDALTRDTLQQELAQLCSAAERPVTVVMVTNSVDEAILLSDRIIPIVPGPPLDVARGALSGVERAPATLGAPIPIELPRPRLAAQLAYDEGATQVRAAVISTLTASLGRPKRSAAGGAGSPVLAAAEETS
jgi:nitrate/nitrite transport system ATP-binding protein